jgi:hypothetical protein
VLLEAVAVVPHQDSGAAKTVSPTWDFHQSRAESWRSVGHVPQTDPQHGMTNQWLKEQGLISVKELRVKIHYPARPGNSVNRPVRTRMPGGVGAGGLRSPATRFLHA